MPRHSSACGIEIGDYYAAALDEIRDRYGSDAITRAHREAHHRGRPHFHATYGADEASIDVESLAVRRLLSA